MPFITFITLYSPVPLPITPLTPLAYYSLADIPLHLVPSVNLTAPNSFLSIISCHLSQLAYLPLVLSLIPLCASNSTRFPSLPYYNIYPLLANHFFSHPQHLLSHSPLFPYHLSSSCPHEPLCPFLIVHHLYPLSTIGEWSSAVAELIGN